MTDERRNGPRDRRLENLELLVARLEERMISNNKSIDLAKVEVDRRLIEMNELRKQIESERRVYLTRIEYDAKHEALVISVNVLQKIMWIATGVLFTIQFAFAVMLRFWR